MAAFFATAPGLSGYLFVGISLFSVALRGIRVNAVVPGFFVNERSRKILMTPDGGFLASSGV